ncbi:GtrA family protein [Streptomyces sp. NPDC058420]|uniref:GtrA family protein n=1 Tax=Streptomyces sp. NPDC058420 TaxID=3346489 RepID=UPI00364E8C58
MTLNLAEERVTEPVRPVRKVVLEVVKFGIVGGTGVLVNFAVFNALLHGLHWPAMLATVLASCVAMGANYLGFRYYTYRDREAPGARRIALFSSSAASASSWRAASSTSATTDWASTVRSRRMS